MRFIRLISGVILLGWLAACSTEKDNTELPAELTSIEDSLYLVLNWQRDTRASRNTAAYRLRPLIIDDRVYSIDTGGTIKSTYAKSGKRDWHYKTGLSAITGLGGNEKALIATSLDGDIIAYRFNDDGLEVLWKVQIDSEIRATPVIDNEQVFVRSVDGKLRSLLAADGTEQWQVSRRVPALSLTGNSKPLVQGELVFAGFDDGKLVAFERANGQVAWETTISSPRGRTEVERLVDLDGDFVIRDGVIYVAAFQGSLAAVQAVSGDVLWTRKFSSHQAIAIDQDSLYLSADDSHLWSIDRRTGSAFWRQDVLHARKITAPSIIDGKLVVADLAGYQHWFNKADGKLLGRIRPTDDRNYVRPMTWKQSVLNFDKRGFISSVSIQE